MKTVYRFVILALISIWTLWGGSAQIKVDRSTVAKGDEVVFDIIATGDKVTFPKIEKIGKYQVDQTGTEDSFVMGSTTIHKQIRSYAFYPDENVTIPSFELKIDGETKKTKPVQIRILPTKSATGGSYTLDMIVSKDTVYTGEPLLLQVVFFEPRNSDIAQAQYFAPKFDGFFVKADQQERLQQTAQGTAHIFDYILTPQKSGTLTIEAPRIKIGIRSFNGARDPWGFFNNEVHWKNIQGQSKKITVKELPSTAELVGSFKIDTSIENRVVKANKPVNYTLRVEGKGSLEDYEGPDFDIDGVTVYSDDPQIKTEIRNDGEIYSKWIKKYTFIADSDFTIPSVKIDLFDPQKGKIENISTKPISISVKGGQNKPSTPPTNNINASIIQNAANSQKALQSPPNTTAKAKENNRSLLEDVDYYAKKALKQKQNSFPWWWLVLSFAVGIVLTLFSIKYLSKFKRKTVTKISKRKYTIDEALDILYPHTNDNPEIEEMVRQLYKAQRDKSIKIDQKKLQKVINSLNGLNG